MFSKSNSMFVCAPMARYCSTYGDLYIEYDKADHFQASLTVVTHPTSLSFCSLVFSYVDKQYGKDTFGDSAILTVKHDGNNNVYFSVTSTRTYNTRAHEISLVKYTLLNQDTMIDKIKKQMIELTSSHEQVTEYLTNEDVLDQSKKILMHFNDLTSRLLALASKEDNDLPKDNVMATYFEKISKLFAMEIACFDNIIELRKPSSMSPKNG